ncbi:TRAP transporter small permease subunit [Tistrella mobilis]|uniref:TRAP transporter small permease subunit n=1 Tax=Tistrella mobilis TaxID=171437 RepID=UPI003557E55F
MAGPGMSGPGRVETPAPAPRTGPLGRVAALASAVGTAWILVMMVLVNADVLGRAAFAAPLRGVPEFVGLSIVGIVFLQAGHALASGRFTRSDALLDRLAAARPRAAAALDVVHHLAGAAFFGILAWALWPRLLRAIEAGDYVGAAGDFTLPVWPIRALMIGGSVLVIGLYLILAAAAARRAAGGRS